MLIEELVELVKRIQDQQAEAQVIEVKAAHRGCPARLYDTLSGFANQDAGGTIVFGLEEESGFACTGVYDLQDLQKKVTEQCNQMEPPVRGVFTFTKFQGKSVAAVEIPAVDVAERPCYYRGKGKVKGSYIRVGDADLPMTDYEIYSYEAFRRHVRDDEREVERARIELLDRDRLEEYLRGRKKERPQFARMPKKMMYEMLNITKNGIPTLAALINFGIYPQGLYPQYGITAIAVSGYEIGEVDKDDARFLDNKRIEGTLDEMVEEAVAFCKRNMKVKTIIQPDTGRRADKTEYPVNAIREAVLNALIHRDYSVHTEGTPIQLNLFRDRLELHSPGTLYGRMTVEQLGVARPDLRNPALAVMAESLTGAENRYSGIPTIRREMAKFGLPAPRFENRRNEFVVTLYNENYSDDNFRRDVVYTESYPVYSEVREPALVYMGAAPGSILRPVPPVYPAVRKDPVQSILEFCREPKSRGEIAAMLGIRTNFYVMEKYVAPLVAEHRLALTIPEKPKSKFQRYYTVE